FHTAGWIFGSGLAVQCVELSPAHPGSIGELQRGLAEAPSLARQARVQQADLVVRGQVSEVREVPRDPSQPITEHDPVWQDAVIRVHDVPRAARGEAKPKEVVVR